jgi:hypothetical protein
MNTYIEEKLHDGFLSEVFAPCPLSLVDNFLFQFSIFPTANYGKLTHRLGSKSSSRRCSEQVRGVVLTAATFDIYDKDSCHDFVLILREVNHHDTVMHEDCDV